MCEGHAWRSGLARLRWRVPWRVEESRGSHRFNLPPQCSLATPGWWGEAGAGQLLLRTLSWVSRASQASAILPRWVLPGHRLAKSDLGCFFFIIHPRAACSPESSPAGPRSRCPWLPCGAICLWGSSLSCPCGSAPRLPVAPHPAAPPTPNPVTASPPHLLPLSTFLSSQQPPGHSAPSAKSPEAGGCLPPPGCPPVCSQPGGPVPLHSVSWGPFLSVSQQ